MPPSAALSKRRRCPPCRTRPGGRITKEDVLTHIEAGTAKATEGGEARCSPARPRLAVPGHAEGERRERMMPSASIAERLVAAQNTPPSSTTFNEVTSAVMDLRATRKARRHGVGLASCRSSQACVEVRAFPWSTPASRAEVVIRTTTTSGGGQPKGLMVPVLRDAGAMPFAAIEKRIAELAVKARDGKIAVADLQGGTFTITNGGTFGSLLSTPILNPPQSAILGMHAIQKRPIAVGDQVVIRPMMYLALSYDHRLIDGREAVQFRCA